MASNIYPFSESFQLKILALLARHRDVFFTYREVVQPKYFRKDMHIDLARIIYEYYDKEMDRAKVHGTEVNPPTEEVLIEEVRKLCSGSKVKEKLAEQYAQEVFDIVDTDLSDAEYVKETIVGFGKNAALQHAILESVDEIEKGTDDYGKIEDLITKAIRVGDDVSDLGMDYFENAGERAEAYSKGTDGVRRIPTGMSGLDKVLKGGLGCEELGVIIAPPNRGKSIALVNIGSSAVLDGKNVFHYTLEMSEEQVAKRYDSRMLNKDFDYLKSNASKSLAAILNIQKLHKGHLIIKKYPTGTCTVNTIRSHITKVYMEKGIKPDLIIVDYADILQPTRHYKEKRYELSSIYYELRDMGSEFNVPVWTASQTNRGGLDKKIITMGDLAEAFDKAAIADFMVALCQSMEERENGEMRLHIAKNRDGTAGVTLNADIEYPLYKLTVYDPE